jgi:hypothetical protein
VTGVQTCALPIWLKKRLEGQAAEVKEAMQALDDKDSSKAQLRKR